WAHCVEHWRSTRHCSGACVEHLCPTQEIAPNVWCDVAPHMMVKRVFFALRARKCYQTVICKTGIEVV
ncbi:hypothetical protein, partial [Bifidobacterium aesculapii]|uniref:hypothetical protein n=1 Tax=Bifidobacterium aesculapii TaxID=1329411 RepID=UPI001F1A23E8